MDALKKLLLAVTLTQLLVPGCLWAQRASVFADDQFGYQLSSDAACASQWVDISASGQALSLQAAGAEAASDEGAALVSLSEAFEFYGREYLRLVVSSNAYVAFAETLAEENGADFSNDCPLPAVPDNGAAKLGRVAVLHDDLQAGSGGEIYQAYLNPCPRPGDFPGEACTVIQWQNWDYHNQTGASLSFQLLLYHQSRQLVAQYQNPGAISSDSATLGLQSPRLDSAASFACNTAASVPSGGSWCATYPLSAEQILVNGFE